MLDSKMAFVGVSALVFWRFGSVMTLNLWFIAILVNFLVPGVGSASSRETIMGRIKMFLYPVTFVLKVGVQTMLCMVVWPPIVVVNVVMFRDYELPWVFENPFVRT